MNVAKYVVAIFTIVGISGLLYTSSFLPSVFAQGAADTQQQQGSQQQQPSQQQQGSQQEGVGTFEELQNLTQGNEDLLANNTDISNTSLSSGLELEQDTDQPNATAAQNETDQQQADHDPQGQIGPALDQSAAPQQNQTEQQQPAGQEQQQPAGQEQQQPAGQEQQQPAGQEQNQTEQQQPAGQEQQQPAGQQQNQTGQAAGPLDQILEPFKGLLGGGQ